MDVASELKNLYVCVDLHILVPMALIPPFFLDCVVAIGTGADTPERQWIASGFLYGHVVQPQEKGYRIYLVTNRHVFATFKDAYVRFNPKEAQPAREYLLHLVDDAGKPLWFAHPNPEVDVAAIPINANRLHEEGIQFAHFHDDVHVSNRKKSSEIGVAEGDLVYILGFPMGLIGGERNYVIVRQGSIARIRDALAGASREFLIDAFIFPGNSGGPVVTKPEIVSIAGTQAISSAYLIGLIRSYLPYTDIAVSLQTKKPRVTFEENSGLASVIPVDFIAETIQVHLDEIEKIPEVTSP